MFYANYMRERMKNLPKYAEAEGNSITIKDSLKRLFRGLRLGGEIENPTIRVLGKNLFDIDNLNIVSINAWEKNNYSPKVENGIFYCGGYATKTGGSGVYVWCGTRPCTISVNVIAGATGDYYDQITITEFDGITQDGYYINNTNLKRINNLKNQRYVIQVAPTKKYISLRCTSYAAKYKIQLTNIQIEFGETATEYEPYKEEQTVTLEGMVLAEGDSISHNRRNVTTDIGGIKTDITDTEAGQALLSLHTNKGTTNIFLDSTSNQGEIKVKYERS